MGGKDRVVRTMAGIGAGTNYGVHGSNVHNLARGVAERVLYVQRGEGLGKAPQPIDGVFNSRLGKLRNRLLKQLRPTPIVSVENYPTLYVGRKRAIYERAAESLEVRGITPADARVSTFVKAEKVNFSSKVDPAPRVIQPRDPRYTLSIGRYLKCFEGQLCHGFERTFGYPVILKGKNADEVGKQLHDNWLQLREPVGIGLDASRFDQHVSQQALKFEHGVYNSVFQSPELRRLLKWQLVNKGVGRTTDGIVKYTSDGCRMSGDINTSMGNCFLMSTIVLGYMESVGVAGRLANNGDDCVVFIEKVDLHKLDGIAQWFLDFGFTLTQEPPAYELEKVEFCQSRPVMIGGQYRMVRNPFTAMSKDAVSLLSWDTSDDIKRWASAVSSCGLSLTSGVPVWEAWYGQLSRLGGERHAAADNQIADSGLGYMARGVRKAEINQQARYSFYLAYGVTPDQQLALEAEYATPIVVTGQRRVISPSEIQNLDHNPLKWLKPRS